MKKSRATTLGSKRPTIRDVAQLAGVATMTVSRAIRTPELVSKNTRARVEEAIRKLDYIPNLIAGSLSSQKNRLVAVVVPSINHSIFAETLDIMSDLFESNGYQVLIGNSGWSIDKESVLVKTALSRGAEGIVLTGYTHAPETISTIQRSRIPTIEMWNIGPNPLDMMVGISIFNAAKDMVLTLGRRGYRRIGYIGGPTKNNDRFLQREAGFLDGLERLGLKDEPLSMMQCTLDYEVGAQSFLRFWEKHPDLDAIFIASDILAVSALLACISKDIKVPHDIAIAGFDDAPLSRMVTPPLTTVRFPRALIGQVVAETMINRLENREIKHRVIDLGYEIIEREST
jgi:LacI family gluconate utilization system Gnt-I transcriptional repressor